MLLSASSCSTEQLPLDIHFAAAWNDAPLGCDGSGTTLTDLRFFVTDITVFDSKGQAHPVAFVGDAPWQQADIALLDLENGGGSCRNGTPQMNSMLHATTELVDIAGIRFTVGVPFSLNHENPLLAAAPLDNAAMHWHWRSGYKFLRAGVVHGEDNFWLHLGSTACEGTVQNISSCAAPNRVSVELPEFRRDQSRINVDLAALFAGIDLADGIPGDCSSGPAEADCSAPFQALGLAFGEDTPENSVQTVFRVAQ